MFGTPKIKYILFRPTNLKFLVPLLDECAKISNWGSLNILSWKPTGIASRSWTAQLGFLRAHENGNSNSTIPWAISKTWSLISLRSLPNPTNMQGLWNSRRCQWPNGECNWQVSNQVLDQLLTARRGVSGDHMRRPSSTEFSQTECLSSFSTTGQEFIF